jgi:3-oxoacyl-[acyl-carrier-protein] synthase-3
MNLNPSLRIIPLRVFVIAGFIVKSKNKLRMPKIEEIVSVVGERVVDNALFAGPATVEATGFKYSRTTEKELFDLCLAAAQNCNLEGVGAVIAASFSYGDRFPSLSARLVSGLNLPTSTMAFDLGLACSAYPYAIYLSGEIASSLNKKVLVIDGDKQSRLLDGADEKLRVVMGDAASATIVSTTEGESSFKTFTSFDRALSCPSSGPISMDGFKVFSFVATKVAALIKEIDLEDINYFVPHQANMYMVRQLAKSVGLEDRLITSGEKYGNVGSSSIPLTLSENALSLAKGSRALIAGFGAGLSAAALKVEIGENFRGVVL